MKSSVGTGDYSLDSFEGTTGEKNSNFVSLYTGIKKFFNPYVKVEIDIILHVNVECIEIIAFRVDNYVELPRMYISEKNLFESLPSGQYKERAAFLLKEIIDSKLPERQRVFKYDDDLNSLSNLVGPTLSKTVLDSVKRNMYVKFILQYIALASAWNTADEPVIIIILAIPRAVSTKINGKPLDLVYKEEQYERQEPAPQKGSILSSLHRMKTQILNRNEYTAPTNIDQVRVHRVKSSWDIDSDEEDNETVLTKGTKGAKTPVRTRLAASEKYVRYTVESSTNNNKELRPFSPMSTRSISSPIKTAKPSSLHDVVMEAAIGKARVGVSAILKKERSSASTVVLPSIVDAIVEQRRALSRKNLPSLNALTDDHLLALKDALHVTLSTQSQQAAGSSIALAPALSAEARAARMEMLNSIKFSAKDNYFIPSSKS